MRVHIRQRHAILSLVWLMVAACIASSLHATAQEPRTTQLTILVRDTGGQPLGGLHVH